MRKIYIVTGAGGYLGRAVINALEGENSEIRILYRREATLEGLPSDLIKVKGDILSPESLEPLFVDSDGAEVTVIHSAAVITVRKKDKSAADVNLTGTENIARLSLKHGVAKFIYISSTDALPSSEGIICEPERFYPDALGSEYARSKAAATQRILDLCAEGLNGIILLPSCILGPGDLRGGLTSRLISVYLNGAPPVGIRGGYDFTDVRDVAAAVVSASHIGRVGQCYILSGRIASVTEVFNILARHTGRRRITLQLPASVLYLLLPFVLPYCRLTKKQPFFTSSAVRILSCPAAFDHTKASLELGYSPRSLSETVTDTADFLLKQKLSIKHKA